MKAKRLNTFKVRQENFYAIYSGIFLTDLVCFNVQSTLVVYVSMYRVHRLYMFQCTEYTGCIFFNVQSTLVVYVSMYRVHQLYMFQCTEYTGCVCFNTSSLYYTSKCTPSPPLEPHTKKLKADQMTTLHQLSLQLPDTRQSAQASTHTENLCL